MEVMQYGKCININHTFGNYTSQTMISYNILRSNYSLYSLSTYGQLNSLKF